MFKFFRGLLNLECENHSDADRVIAEELLLKQHQDDRSFENMPVDELTFTTHHQDYDLDNDLGVHHE